MFNCITREGDERGRGKGEGRTVRATREGSKGGEDGEGKGER